MLSLPAMEWYLSMMNAGWLGVDGPGPWGRITCHTCYGPICASVRPAAFGRHEQLLQSQQSLASEERPRALVLKLRPCIIQLHEDHLGILLIWLPSGL